MESTEKKRPGKNVVAAILLLATLGAGLTWMRYSAQAPSTGNALLVSDRVVIATFNARAARNIREGTSAIVTFENSAGRKFPGTVQSLRTEDLQTRAVVVLEEAPPGVRSQARCDVTVDTSVAAEALKTD